MLATLRSPRFTFWLLITTVVLVFTMPAFAAPDKCPAVNAIGNFKPSALVAANFSGPVVDVNNNSTFTYTFSGLDPAIVSTDGVPGLITYCVFPQEPPGNPDAISVDPTAQGANGQLFQAIVPPAGSFSFTRADGNPSNIAFDGTTYTMGTATWFPSCTTVNSITTCTPVSPADQTILLHINDATECQSLYGGTASTCFVFPGNTPPHQACNGNPACKSAVISDINGNIFGTLDSGGNVIVPEFTQLFIDYTYVIVNQPTNNFNMIFKFPPSKTDINNGGGKDYFGCEQLPNPAGFPGTWGNFTFTDGNGNVWKISFTQTSGTCNQSRFTLLPNSQTIVLTPGQSVTFTVNMVTRKNKSGKFEYTSTGLHLLNSGFTVKWFQTGPGGVCTNWTGPGTLCSFSTSNTPIFVDVQ